MFKGITTSYTMAFVMRSGSNAICDLLARNGLGSPTEWFQKPLIAVEGEPWLKTFARFVNERQAEGVFGSKMSHDQRAALDASLREAVPGYRYLDDVLPGHRWVRLVRQDKVLQAISLCQAESSGVWAMTDPNQMQSGEFDYDFFLVLSRLMGILAGEFAWDRYFRQHGIAPLVIVYEDFWQSLDLQLPLLIDYLGGLPLGRETLDVGQSFRIQRNDANHALRQRFVSDLSRIGEPNLSQIDAPWERWIRLFAGREWRSSDRDGD